MRQSDLPATFCVNPWIQQTVLPTGAFSFCCAAAHGGPIKDATGHILYWASQNPFPEVWNSPETREIRKRMLNGQKVRGCETCYFQESIGKKSSREMLNEEWFGKIAPEIWRRVEDSRRNDGTVSSRALYLDLRLGNLCTLKCRTCNPFNSTKIYAETEQMLAGDAEFKKFYHEVHTWKLAPIEPWYESEEFWTSVETHLPDLRKVYLTGGEPTLIKRNLQFLRRCIDEGHAEHIFLMLNTNCTRLTDEFFDLLPHFEFTLVNCSLDAFGSVNEYIREGTKWETIDANVRRLVSLSPRIQVGFTPVVQILNAYALPELLDYIERLNEDAHRSLNVDFLYANHPEYMDIRNLPDHVRAKAAKKLEAFTGRSKLYHANPYVKNSVDSGIRALRGPRLEGAEQKFGIFMKYNGYLDRQRGRDMAAAVPELATDLS